ncbi:hypothetical protein Bca52824_026738 [Brassica carinata]|uniref:Uncharacterized protein n=1 Tax=Brassica carinata TaxID=52824 RepID=A0A8X7V876_BRACI|nr:hypothetical protein Bca52824_026738 [Brassica carinata]
MEAITKYGLHSQALVHLRQQNFGWEFDGLWREIETLKPRLSDKLVCSDTKNRILLINTLVNLGVAYHFEKEIEEFMKDAFEKVEDITGGEEDMYTISVIFRVFRRYGHNVSSDMFNKFKGENGDFKKCLTDDVRGMLSFYEASHHGTKTEEILDEVMQFTKKHLELFVGRTNQPHISALIQNVLYLSQQENSEVLRAKEYIRWEFDAVDTLPDHLKVVLKSLIDLFEELKGEVRSEGRLYSVQYAIDELKRLFRANLTIARWARTGYIPNFDEYMEVGLVTGGVHTLLAIAFVGMGKIARKEAYDWITQDPNLILLWIKKHALEMMLPLLRTKWVEEKMRQGSIAT